MDVGQSLPKETGRAFSLEETGQALASADVTVLPESWPVALTASQLPSCSDVESKFDRERCDSNIYVSQETQNMESDCSRRMMQELQELSVDAGLNGNVNSQENTDRFVSSFVKNIATLDGMKRKSSGGSGTGGSTSFDISVNHSPSSMQLRNSSEVEAQITVSRDAEVSRPSRDGGEGDDAPVCSDWCQPCRQKTGPCEDGHVSCEVQKQLNEKSIGWEKSPKAKTSITRQNLTSTEENDSNAWDKAVQVTTDAEIPDEKAIKSQVLSEKGNTSEISPERKDELQSQETGTIPRERMNESRIPRNETCEVQLSHDERRESRLPDEVTCEAQLSRDVTHDSIDFDQSHDRFHDLQSSTEKNLDTIGTLQGSGHSGGVMCESGQDNMEVGERWQDLTKACGMKRMVSESQMDLAILPAEIPGQVVRIEAPTIHWTSQKLENHKPPAEVPFLEEASPKMAISAATMQTLRQEATQFAVSRSPEFISGSMAGELKDDYGRVTSNCRSTTGVRNTQLPNARMNATAISGMDVEQHLSVPGPPVARTIRDHAIPLDPPRNLFVSADNMISPVRKREFRKSSLWKSNGASSAAKPRALHKQMGGSLATGCDVYDFDEKDEAVALPSNSGKLGHRQARKKYGVEKNTADLGLTSTKFMEAVELKPETDGTKMEAAAASLPGARDNELKFLEGRFIKSEEPEIKRMREREESKMAVQSNQMRFDENFKDYKLPIVASPTSMSSSFNNLNSHNISQTWSRAIHMNPSQQPSEQDIHTLPSYGYFPLTTGNPGSQTDFQKPMLSRFINGRDAAGQKSFECERDRKYFKSEAESAMDKGSMAMEYSSLNPVSMGEDSAREQKLLVGTTRENDRIATTITQPPAPYTNCQLVLSQAGRLSNEGVTISNRRESKIGSEDGAMYSHYSAWPHSVSGVCASSKLLGTRYNGPRSENMSLDRNIGRTMGLPMPNEASVASDGNTGFPSTQATVDSRFHASSGSMQRPSCLDGNKDARAHAFPVQQYSIQKQTVDGCSIAAASGVNLTGEASSVQVPASSGFNLSTLSAAGRTPSLSHGDNARSQSENLKRDTLQALRYGTLGNGTLQSVRGSDRAVSCGAPLSQNSEHCTGTFQQETRSSIPTNKPADAGKSPCIPGQGESNEEYMKRLRGNILEEIPDCRCLAGGNNSRSHSPGKSASYEESSEGPYYTQLGAAGSVADVRKMMEERLGFYGDALRIEKVIYSGKEGKSEQGCPIAKWIVRRSGPKEKALVLARPRRNHTCDKAVMVIAVCIWEGLPEDHATELYEYMRHMLPRYGEATERRCGANERKTCACQGWQEETGGASFSFGCSWSMYYNGCKFAKSISPRKFRLKNQDEEGILEHHLQTLATEVAPLYKQVAPESFRNQTQYEDISPDCRLGYRPGRPWSGVTAVVDFCTHAHKDLNNMNNGCTTVVTLTKHRGFEKPQEEQLHVLPLCVLDSTDEFGSREGQKRKMATGALESLIKYPMKMRIRSQPYICKKKQRMLNAQARRGIVKRGRGRGRRAAGGMLGAARALYMGRNVPTTLGAPWNGSRTGHVAATAGRLLTRRAGRMRMSDRGTQKDSHVQEDGLSQLTGSCGGNSAGQLGGNPVANHQMLAAPHSTLVSSMGYLQHPASQVRNPSLPSFSHLLPVKQMPGLSMHQSRMASQMNSMATVFSDSVTVSSQSSLPCFKSTSGNNMIGNNFLVQGGQSSTVSVNALPNVVTGFGQTTVPGAADSVLGSQCTAKKLGVKKRRKKDQVGPEVLSEKLTMEQKSHLKNMAAFGDSVVMNHFGAVQMMQQGAPSSDWQHSQSSQAQVSEKSAQDWQTTASPSHQQTGQRYVQDWTLGAQPTQVAHPQLEQVNSHSQVSYQQSGQGNPRDWQVKAPSPQVSNSQSGQGNPHDWQVKAPSPQVSHAQSGQGNPRDWQVKAPYPQVSNSQSGQGNPHDWQVKAPSPQVSHAQSGQGNPHDWQVKAPSPQVSHAQSGQGDTHDWQVKALSPQVSHSQSGQGNPHDWQVKAPSPQVSQSQSGQGNPIDWQVKAPSPQVSHSQSGQGNPIDWQVKAPSPQVSHVQSGQGNPHDWQTKAPYSHFSQYGPKWSKSQLSPQHHTASEVQRSSHQSTILSPFDDKFRMNAMQPSPQNSNQILSQQETLNHSAGREPADGTSGWNLSHSGSHQPFEPKFGEARGSDMDRTRPVSAGVVSRKWKAPLDLVGQETPVDFSVSRGAATPQGFVKNLSNSSSYGLSQVTAAPGRNSQQMMLGCASSLGSLPRLVDASTYARDVQQNSNRLPLAMSNPAQTPREVGFDVDRERRKDTHGQRQQQPPLGVSENSVGTLEEGFSRCKNLNVARLYQPYNTTECLDRPEAQIRSPQLNTPSNSHHQPSGIVYGGPGNSVQFQSPLDLLADASMMLQRYQPENRTQGTSVPVEMNLEQGPYTPEVTVNQGYVGSQQAGGVGGDGGVCEAAQQMTNPLGSSNDVHGKEVYTENERCFLDGSIGGVAIALSHGSVLFEVAKRELHATTALKQPDRSAPTRISMVFYQHKNLNYPHHGYEEYQRRIAERKQKKLEDEAAGMRDAPNETEDAEDVECQLPDFQPFPYQFIQMNGGMHTMAHGALNGPYYEWK